MVSSSVLGLVGVLIVCNVYVVDIFKVGVMIFVSGLVGLFGLFSKNCCLFV